MDFPIWTRRLAGLAAAAAVSACSPGAETATVPTDAVSDAADVSAMDTGPYAIAASHPYGAAGNNANTQGVLESQRIAQATVGPWSVSPKFIQWGTEFNIVMTGRLPSGDALRWQLPGSVRDTDPLPGIASRNGMLAGFSTQRVAQVGDRPSSLARLHNMVLRFPDGSHAAAAASQMAQADPGPPDKLSAGLPTALNGEPQSRARTYRFTGGATMVRSFTPHGAFVLYQEALTPPDAAIGIDAANLASSTLAAQKKLIDTYTPTPAEKMADLPLDPSGSLFARTLNNPGDSPPAMVGVWAPQAWVAFEDNPPEAAAMLSAAGVDWVSQRLATVYQTKNADTAEKMLAKVVSSLRTTPSAKPTATVPGLPRARCFERPGATELANAPESWQRVFWNFKCAASAGRYVFTVYASSQQDAAQRISAQWRILAGK